MASDAVHARVPHRDSGTKTPDGSLVTPRPGAWDPCRDRAPDDG